ncbi:hypothetical protein, partial [Yersinia intermedia]|uniref:hypothetical protein n=1 Tax=Yersinia intermedia TaxID=631 RepID=UPI0039C64953
IWFGGYKIIKSRQFNILYLTRTDFWGLVYNSMADVAAFHLHMNVVTKILIQIRCSLYNLD